jgi:ferric-dicitrate binding protein FerR (iron transport regulator)
VSNKQQNISDDVLVKHLLGEATPAEQREVELWVAAGNENRRYYDHFKLIWEQSKQLELKSNTDTEEAWGRFMQRVETEEELTKATTKRTIPLWSPFSLVRIAAMLVLMVGAGWLIYTVADGGNDQMTVASADGVLKHTLPDGSVVTLNKNSTLAYSAAFNGSSRNVALKGEAFFDVAPDKSKPFIIDAGNSTVTVVGTSFNVKSRKDITEVIVESGVVEVAKKQQMVRLTPGQSATVSPVSDAPIAVHTEDALYDYYRTHEFKCDGVPLYKLVATLNEAYDVQIVIADTKLANLQKGGILRMDDLNTVLDIIEATFKDQLYIEKNGKKIVLRAR